MKILRFLKDKRKRTNLFIWLLAAAIVLVVVWGWGRDREGVHMEGADPIEEIDLDSIYFEDSGVSVSFSDVILSDQNEMRKLIVNTQQGTVNTELTDRLIEKLDFDFLKKTQTVSYIGTGYFVVDLDNLTADNVIEDREKKTVTICIDHAYLQAIEIDPDKIIIDEVKEGLLARGDIELTVWDYNVIAQDLRTRLEKKFNTAANGQKADEIALRMVREIYEPIVRAIDRRYDVHVQFK